MSNLDDDDEGGAEVDESWMGTFSDLCLLLLVFFVLMVSMSTMEQVKFVSFFGSMRDALGAPPFPDDETGDNAGATGAKVNPPVEEFLRIREQINESQRVAYNEIQSYLELNSLEDQFSALWKDGKVVIQVPDEVLFQSGSEELSPEAEPYLQHLLNIFLSQRAMNVNIMGYTDNSPMPAGVRFEDHWELSALRAVNVLRWFMDHGIPIVRLTATGMGEMDPVASNATPEGRAKNRRVEFVLERKVGH